VPEQTTKQRIDAFLAENGFGTRTLIQRSIERGLVTVNGIVCSKSSYRVQEGEKIQMLELPEVEKSAEVVIEESEELFKKVLLIHEDKDYLVVMKPAGLIVHPTEAKEKVTLAAWVVSHYPDVATVGDSPIRPGIVHRLDKEASGLLVVARTQKMFEHLKDQFKNRTVDKNYTVLVYGSPAGDHGTINFIIDRGKDGKMIARPNTQMTLRNVTQDRSGKEALTEFDVLKRFARYTLLSVRLHTGRMHQIRVHMYAFNHPVVGDMLYYQKAYFKKNDPLLGRLFLHASKLSFTTLENKKVSYEAPLPEELTTYLEALT
ncbi:MAG TPA: RluA family pseudouridine synthase, partial [Candidatus Magasanikbacteria bacterium]|nr:RluA family pseudouridine synthase [Candidatus Magasanikbacteria bacterium]